MVPAHFYIYKHIYVSYWGEKNIKIVKTEKFPLPVAVR